MPELPEVETIARDLRARVIGKRVCEVWTSGKALRLARAVDVEGLRRISIGPIGSTNGNRIRAIRRLGKYLIIDMDKTAGVVVHLGMSGRLQVAAADAPRQPHTHVVLSFGDGTELRFRDPRRFGWISAADPVDEADELRGLGPDPLIALSSSDLAEKLRAVRAPIKAFLLDQSRVAGLGNIYVCEALFRARIHPATAAGRVVRRAERLLHGIRAALELGIENRGTTLRDYVDAFGDGGNNAHALLVYGREREPCRVCANPIRRRIDAGRSTFYCGRCQRR